MKLEYGGIPPMPRPNNIDKYPELTDYCKTATPVSSDSDEGWVSLLTATQQEYSNILNALNNREKKFKVTMERMSIPEGDSQRRIWFRIITPHPKTGA